MSRTKWAAGLAGVALIVATTSPTLAVPSQSQQVQTAERLRLLGVVQGAGTDPVTGQVEFNLGANITRAELITTIVRSFGLESAAVTAKGAPSFPDVPADAWFSGYVAVAKNLAAQKGVAIGRAEGTFDPNAPVTRAETLVFILKFLGINATGSTSPWYQSWLNEAVARGVLSAGEVADLMGEPDGPAPRGEAFVILDKGYGAKVLPGGKSLYTTYLDSVAPALAVVSPPATTSNFKVTITGTVTDNKGVAGLYANGDLVSLAGTAFTVTKNLTPGANAINLRAVDLAGNETEEVVTIARVAGTPTKIEVADLTVQAGATVDVATVVKDAMGTVLSGVDLSGTSAVGTYAHGKFTAQTNVGSGLLTLTAPGGLSKQLTVTILPGPVAKVMAPGPVAPGELVTLQVTDAYGNPAGGGNTAFSVSSPDALLNGARFIASKPGVYTVKATKDGVSVEGQVAVYGPVAALRFVPGQAIVANNSPYDLQVEVVDAHDTRVVNYGDDSHDERIQIFGPAGLNFTATLVKPTKGLATFRVTASPGLSEATVDLRAELQVTSSIRVDTAIAVVAQQATSLQIKAPKVHRVNNSDPTTITVEVLDQAGKPMLEGVHALKLGVAGAATLTGGAREGALDWMPVSKTFDIVAVDAATTGPITLTVSGEGLPAATATLQAQFATTPTALQLRAVGASTVSALNAADAGAATVAGANGKALTYEVTVVDPRQIPVPQETARIDLQFTGVSAPAQTWVSVNGVTWVDLSTYNPAVHALTVTDGKATFYVLGSNPGTFQIKAREFQDGAGGYAELGLSDSSYVTGTVAVGQAALARFQAGTTLYLLRGSPTRGDVVVQLTDGSGNAVRQAGVSVTVSGPLTGVQLNGEVGSATALTDANGKATFALQASASLAEVHLQITDLSWNGGIVTADPSYDELLVKAAYQLPKSVSMVVRRGSVQPSVIDAGDDFTVEVTVLDQDRHPYDTLQSTDLALSIDGKVVPYGVVPVGNGVYRWDLPIGTLYRAGNSVLRVDVLGQATAITTTRSLSVRAAAPHSIRLAEATWTDNGDHLYDTSDTFSLKGTKNQIKAYTLQIVDQYGNLVAPTAVTTPWTISLGGSPASGGYIAFSDAGGIPTSSAKIGLGKNTATFYLRSDKGGTLSFTSGSTVLTVILTMP